ncbi:MAG: hypothetical protein ABI072_05435 [Edaphobacter sp.]
MAVFAVIMELGRIAYEKEAWELTPRGYRMERAYLVVMVGLGWAAVLSGAYLVYPWYRAALPPGVVDLAEYPRQLLMSKATTAGWHTLGMEWKEHVAWFAPIAITMVAYVLSKYGRTIRQHPEVKRAVVAFAMVALLATGIAGFWGAMIEEVAPMHGGRVVMSMRGAK